MIDLHTHVLPAIDDGAVDFDDAVAMCHQAAATGCEALVATPHQRHPRWMNTNRAQLEDLFSELRDRVGPEPKLLLGGELRIGPGFLEDLETFEASGLCSIAGSKYLLVEFPRRRLQFDPSRVIRSIARLGWRPIVAHPEFVPGVADELSLAEDLVRAGALLQLTAMSVTGDFGDRARGCVHDLIERGLAHFISSDSHDTDWRRPDLKPAWSTVAERWGEEVAVRLTTDNPRAVVENRRVEPQTTRHAVSNLPSR
ncbi:MAG: hypothetical protein P8Y44_12865 [Acidobacteriota bacterium]